MSKNIVPPDGITNLTIGTKVKRWLTGFFGSVDVANGANAAVNTLQRNTAYAVGDIVQCDLVHAKYRLVCTTAGTTGSTAPSFEGKTVGSTVADGTTLVWTVREFATIESESIGDTDTPVYVTGGKVTSIGSTLFSKIVTHLASATAASISSLNTSSLFYRMLSWALTASGVQYNFTNSSAWYICFGSLLGGLIIQGGTKDFPFTTSAWRQQFVPPISFSNSSYQVLLNDASSTDNTSVYSVKAKAINLAQIYVVLSANATVTLNWIAIGK